MTVSTEDHAMLAADAYNTHVPGAEVTLGGIHYKVINEVHDRVTGYQGTAYVREDTGDVVIAHCGTDTARMKYQDIATDAGMVTAGVNAQTFDAMAFTKKSLELGKKFDEQSHLPFHATVTGHSLGGTLAEITAYQYHLHGETFNAYGAAGLFQGVPEGGHQVINYVRATDVVSAGSQHFGETHIYASPQDIERLQKAGYHNDNGVMSPRVPIKGVDLDAHSATNFLPDNPRLGHSIISKENEALYESHKGMFDQYRHDVLVARSVISARWEVEKKAVELEMATGRFVGEKAVDGAHAVERATQYVGNEAVKGYNGAVDATSRGIEATAHAAQYAEHETVKGYRATVDATSRGIEATVHAAQYVEHEAVQKYDATVDATSRGIEATVHGARYVAHETVKGYDAVVDATSRGIEATAHAAEHVAKEVSQGTQAGAVAVGEAYAQRRPESWSAHTPLLNDPAHPDHRLFQQAYDGVKKVDAEHGRVPDHHSLNLAGALTVEAKARGLRQVDVVALSEDGANAFAVEKDGRIGSTSFARVDTMQAVHTPIEHSSQQMAQINQQLQQQAQQQIQQQAAQLNPQQASPGMAR
ncbi:XVIPCD domain-containing protein [Rhodanobacter sp. BL-MT-08]